MRYIVLGLVISLLAVTLGTRSGHADIVSSAGVTNLGGGCYDYNLNVNNNDKGPSIASLLASVTWTPDGGTCSGDPTNPNGWTREVLAADADSTFVKWQANSSKFYIKTGSQLSGFKARVPACPVFVELWTTNQPNGTQIAAGSFTIPCP